MSTRRPLVPLTLALGLLSLAAAPARAIGPFEFLLERLSALWAETGCTFDPNGRCSDRSAPTGCTVDPHGVCRDQGAAGKISANTGCTFDPDGRCREISQSPSPRRSTESRQQ